MRVLHAIHDFLPRHRAGSEIYALELCRELGRSHDVTILCAEYDPSREHGRVAWRVQQGLPVVEIVNNWMCRSFAETYAPPLITERIAQVLQAVQPDVIHVHNLLNLSFDLPALAHTRGIPVVATLHDYTLVCPSGGQRIHREEQHVCMTIEPDRCARCFRESPYFAQIAFGRVIGSTRASGIVRRRAAAAVQRLPWLAGRMAEAVRHVPAIAVEPTDIEERLAAARRVFREVDLFVAPSASLAGEFERLGIDRGRIRVSDYGFAPLDRAQARPSAAAEAGRLRIGFVGSMVWHKGLHVLVDAVRQLPDSSYEVKVFGNPAVSPGYAGDLRARAEGLPVHLMGPFDRERTSDVYAQMDVLVVPSIWLENSPLVIHEAFMAGVPVVGARIGGIAELVDHGRTGLLYDPGSPAELAAALDTLIKKPADLARMAAAAGGASRVKSIAEDAREWEQTYAQVLRHREASVGVA